MRIIMVAYSYYGSGGNERQLRILSEYFANNGNQVSIVLTGKENYFGKHLKINNSSYSNILYSKGLKIRGLDTITQLIWFAFYLAKLRKDKSAFYILGLSSFAGAIAFIANFYGLKTSVMVADPTAPNKFPCFGGDILRPFWKMIFIKYISNFICISKEIYDLMFNVYKNSILLPIAIDTNIFHPISLEKKKRQINKLGLSSGFIAIYCGRLEERKGLERILLTWKEVIKEIPSALLLILGSGSLFGKLKARVKVENLTNNVIFLGEVEKPELYLQVSDVFILLSESEGMSNAVIEAMACGTVCILSPQSATSTCITHNNNAIVCGTDSQLTDDDASLLCANTIIELYKYIDKRKMISENAINIIKQRFDISILGEKYKEIFCVC